MLSTRNIGKPPEEQPKPAQVQQVQSGLWTSKSAAYESALKEIITRRDNPTGIYNLKTPWSVLNDITFGGIQWQTLNVFAGRPGSGKTLIKDQLLRYATEHQPNVRILTVFCLSVFAFIYF
jgi:replicative DNA helicase